MEKFFACDSSCPTFKKIWSDPLNVMTQMIAGDNSVKILTIPYLKMLTQAEWSTFNKCWQKEENYHFIEAKGSRICYFINNGAAFLNKHKHQAFGM